MAGERGATLPRTRCCWRGDGAPAPAGRACAQRRAGGSTPDSGSLCREPRAGHASAGLSCAPSRRACAQRSAPSASLGGHRTLPIGPRSRCMEETLRGFPPRLLSGGGSPGHCWVLSSIPGPLSCDNENVPWGQNCLGSIHASACLRGWRCAQLEAPRYPEVEQPRLQWGAHSLMNRNKLLSYGARLRTAFPP